MKTLRLFAAAALLCWLPLVSISQAAETCVGKDAYLAFLSREAPEAKIVAYDAEDARLILAALATATRTPAVSATIVLFIDLSPQAPAIKAVLFEAGCMSRIGTFPRPLITRILNELARTGA